MRSFTPDNLYVLLGHVKCAAYELPFEEGETYAQGVSTKERLTISAKNIF